MLIPDYLLKLGKTSQTHQAWVDALPSAVKHISDEWELILEDIYVENASCSYVRNCRTKNNELAVLKIGFPHFEAAHEIAGLRLLNGLPTVRLLNFDKAHNAMLLERCVPGTSLHSVDAIAQDTIICELLQEIWQADHTHGPFNRLGEMVALWNKEAMQNLHHYPDSSLAKEGCQLKEHLIDTTEEAVLLATDLHAGNVLKAQRKPWLVIDIKPHIGDRAYDLTQHLMNSLERLATNPVRTINDLADRAKVSNSRLKDWMFARLASENNGIYQEIALTLR